MEPYYPVNDEKNNALFEEYKKLAEKEENVIFGGRLGQIINIMTWIKLLPQLLTDWKNSINMRVTLQSF